MTSGIKPKIGLYHVGNSPTKQLCTRKIAKTGVCVLEHTALAEKCPESECRTYPRNAARTVRGHDSHPKLFEQLSRSIGDPAHSEVGAHFV